MKLSQTDQELLNLLRENARTSTAQLARRIGVSRTTVQSRLERLESEGTQIEPDSSSLLCGGREPLSRYALNRSPKPSRSSLPFG